MKLQDHPTVREYKQNQKEKPPTVLPHKAEELKRLAIELGADDAGVVDLSRDSMHDYVGELREVLPGARGVLVLAFGLNQSQIKTSTHSLADVEFKHAWTRANDITLRLTQRIVQEGGKAVSLPAGFPYEANRWPGKMWISCDKVFAREAGLGHMGWNRLVLHPKMGAAMVLSSILLGEACDLYDQPIDYNPCLECGLCLKVCPVGAVKREDAFDFMACYTHNYRERLGGFVNWVEEIADSRSRSDYRKRISDRETVSMWQHLAIGAQTRCDRCMAVCPAGSGAVGEYLDDRKEYVNRYVKRFSALEEPVYVVKGSDAETHLVKKFPVKTARYVSNGIRPASAAHFLESMPLAFQPGKAQGLAATYHFLFTGEESVTGTVDIRDGAIEVKQGLHGKADLTITADSRTWVDFLAGEKNLIIALITRKLRLKGSPALMKAFASCFLS